MKPEVSIVVCYRQGTLPMMKVWLSSLFGHTTEGPLRVVILTADNGSFQEASVDFSGFSSEVEVVRVSPAEKPPARIHGAMLDAFLPSGVDSEFVLTMDSDCFPIADGWLAGLLGMLRSGARVVGILHPWAPPPTDMDKKLLAWRVRSQHCWETTHVACQMLRKADLVELGVSYTDGDDTGLLVPLAAKRKGWAISGYKPTRCAKPEGEVDPEFNRYVSLIFGDMVYHHGGYTRVTTGGDKPIMADHFGWATEKVLSGQAEIFLKDDWSYRFKFDREEEVAQDKLDRLFGVGAFKK
jgi:hypothetical protein